MEPDIDVFTDIDIKPVTSTTCLKNAIVNAGLGIYI